MLGLDVRDLTGGFKCFRREVLEAIHFDSVRSQGYAFQVELTYRAVRASFRVVEVPIVFKDRERGQSKMSWRIAAEAMWLVPLLRAGRQPPPPARSRGGVRAGRAHANGLTYLRLRSPGSRADEQAMDASAYAFAHGVRYTRTTLRAWQRHPGAVLGRWFAGSALAAFGLLVAVLVVSVLSVGYVQIVTLGPPFAVGDGADVLNVLGHNLLVLTLHAMACIAGFIAGSSLPLQASSRSGLSRWVHEHGGRIAIVFVCLRDRLLAVDPGLYARPHPRRRRPLPGSLPGAAPAGVLPHAIGELIALFLPLAAWIIASRARRVGAAARRDLRHGRHRRADPRRCVS